MFMLRNTQRASKRGYAVAASAASLEVSCNDGGSAQTVIFRWGGDDSPSEMDVLERDGKSISVPRYHDGRSDDCLEGEVATPAVLIEHEPEPEVVLLKHEPEPPSLPVWPGPYSPPPLVAHLYAPYSPPPPPMIHCEAPRPAVLRRRLRGVT
jgi:hypothetical protein